jgi:fucose permease
MMALAIGLNLLPVFLTTLGLLFGGAGGLSGEQLGALGSVMFGGLVAGILLTGPLADRWGAKAFALAGCGLTAASLAAMALAPTYAVLAAALFAAGLAAGMLDMILSPVVAALNPERRAVAMNWLHSFYCVGAVVTILAGTVALEAGLGWRRSCLLLVPLPLFLLAAFLPLRFPSLVAGGRRVRLRRLVRQRWFLGALAAIFLGGATELGMAQWLPAFAERALGYSPWVAGTALLLFSVAMAAGRMAAGAWGGKTDPCLLMAWGCGATVVLFGAGAFSPLPGVALAACVAAGFTGSALWPTLLAVTADRHPEGGATMFGALGAMGNAGGIFMPWAVGWVSDRSDLHWGLSISALAPMALLPLVLWLRKGTPAALPLQPEALYERYPG